MVKVSFSDRVEVPKHVLVCSLEKELVLLNLEAEYYFGLDEIGTRMWQAVTTAESIDDAYSMLSTEFDVDADRLRQDLSELLGKLTEKGLLRIRPTNAGSAPAI
jgi:Coenzyme PQQ synthesis protein D (PqqD)